MKDLLDKLSSYGVFNYLFPGVLFAAAGTFLTSYSLLMDDVVVGVFVYYFYGLTISRVGSLVMEPLFKWSRFVRFAPYEDFVAASRVDADLKLLSEINNMYRTLSSTSFCLLLLFISDSAALHELYVSSPVPVSVSVAFLLFLLFSFSYRKQTQYVASRVDQAKRAKVQTPPSEGGEK